MHLLSEAREALEAVDLRHGLAVPDVHIRLQQGLRLHDTGQRILAFYLTEMADRRLHQDTGHRSVALFAEDRLGLDRRRTAELISAGRKLLTLPAIDTAFCQQQIGWSKVLHLLRVATPEHDAAWLETAQTLTCRELARETRRARQGGPPRKPGDGKGLHEVRFKVAASVDVLTQQMLDRAQQKLSAELERPVDTAELLRVMSELFLSVEEDGSVPGKTRVDASLFRIVVRDEGDELVTETDELGSLPVSRSDERSVRCDAECDSTNDLDPKTPPALRRRVIARDSGQCRCCRSRHQLMVHHIRYRSNGGRTCAWNLITLCRSCHALVHANLLILEGTRAVRVRFLDTEGNALHAPDERVDRAALLELARPSGDEVGAAMATGEAEPTAPEPKPFREAFSGIVGQDALLRRLETTGRGSRALGRCFPHTLFVGPPGTGKTTVARAIAAHAGCRLHATVGPLLPDVRALAPLLASLHEGGMLFIDEVHAVPRPVLETLYDGMANGQFTLLAATTEQGDLPSAFLGRFGLREQLGHYASEDLAMLATHAARAQDIVLEHGAARRLVRSARGTPREVLRLLDRVLECVASGARSRIDATDVDAMLEALGYDREGLDPAEQRYVALLRRSPVPIPLGRLARMLGSSVRTLLHEIEPFLFERGFVQMTPRGRIADHRPRLLEA